MAFFKKLTLFKKALLIGFVFFIAGVAALFGFYYAVAWGILCEMPSDEELSSIKNYQASEVYSDDNILLGRYFVENRSNVSYEEINPNIINALVATEDVRFWKHQGVDQRSLLRVLFKSIILQQHNAGGGSTISQQLIKNVFGRKNYGILSMPIIKVREGILANKLNHLYTKEEIITLYLNTVSFGEDTYGIEVACERFFNTTPLAISTENAAVLIGMLKAPTSYNPRLHPEKSLSRRNTVLSQMMKYEYLTSTEHERLIAKPIDLRYTKKSTSEGIATYFRAQVKKEAISILETLNEKEDKQYTIETDGLKIHTTLNYNLQQIAEKQLVAHIEKLTKKLRSECVSRLKSGDLKPVLLTELKKTQRYKALEKEGLYEKAIIRKLSDPINTSIFTFKGGKDTLISPIDSIIHTITFLQASYLAVDPKSGKVLSWIGGIDYQSFPYDHVLSKRQVGSTFKPFIYANALAKGHEICDKIKNEQVVYSQYDDWSPQNSDGLYGGKYTILGALTNSVNTISVQLLMENGIKNQIQFCEKLGIRDSLPQVPSLALGVANLSLRTLIEAYIPLANNGQKVAPYTITKITDANGEIIYKHQTAIPEQVIDSTIAIKTTQLLQSVVNNGTGQRIRSTYHIDDEIAGKTGTTQNHTDGWFIGYTDNFLAGVWTGADNPSIRFKSIKDGQGANLVLPIWAGAFAETKQHKELKGIVSSTHKKADVVYECEFYEPEKTDLIHQLFKRKKPKENKSDGLEGKRVKKKKSFFSW